MSAVGTKPAAAPVSADRPVLRRAIFLALIAVAAIVVVTAGSWTSEYGLLVGYQIAQLAALALAWNLMAGYGGLVSLAVSAFVGLGSYAAAKLSIDAGFTIIPTILAGGVVAALFAVLVAVPMFRFRGLYFTIASLVLAQALAIFMVNYNGLGGASGLTFTSFAPTLEDLYLLAVAIAAVAILASILVLRARLGIGLLAVRDDEDVAERMGVATFRTKLVAFALSGFVMGMVGALQAQKLGQIEPYGSFALSWTIDTVNAAIVGGLGTIIGPILGAAIIVELREQLADYPEVHVAVTGALLILIIRFAPRGVWGTLIEKLGPRFTSLLPVWLVPRSSGVVLGADPIEPAPGSPLSAVASADGSAAAPARDIDHDRCVLRARGIGKSFGGVKAVDDVDVDVRAGEVLGVIGPNGAGKSTLIGLLSGAHFSDGGTVELFGDDATSLSAQARARRGIGRTHQVPRPFARLTVAENLMVAQMHGAGESKSSAQRECARILRRCGLADVADTPAGDLGLLRMKRLELARALAVRPRLLLLDEIGAGLIESEVEELIELIKSLRDEVESILVVEHVIDVIRECCDRVVVIDRGTKLTEGSPAEVLSDAQVVAVYLGTSGGEEVKTADRARERKGTDPFLSLHGVAAQYGAFKAIQDVSFSVHEGEVLSLLGVNGAGKSTTARAISGMLPVTVGEIWFDGKRIDGRPAHDIVRAGIAHCMEGRQIFADLSVEENLLLGGRTADSKKELNRRLGEMYELFEILKEKRGDSGASLSGGQQQMLAIGRALMAAPRLVLFDEISLGLAPIAVDRLYEALAAINGRGVSMVVIEQNVERGLALADRVAVLEKGRVALEGAPDDVRRDPRLRSLYVGEAAGAA